MAPPDSALDLPGLAAGDRVQHPLLVRERSERTTRDGRPYVVLRLGNPSGTIDTAPVWQEKLPWVDGAERGRLVQVIGDVVHYGDDARRQLQLAAPLRLLPSGELPVDAFLERIDVPADRLWESLDRRRLALPAPLRAAVDAVWADDAFRVAAESAPLATDGPHGRLGALLLHTIEVTAAARRLALAARRGDADVVVAGALLHAVGAVDAFTVSATGIARTEAGRLLGPGTLGVRLLEQRWAEAARTGSGGTRGAAQGTDGTAPAIQDALLHVVLAADPAQPHPALTPEAAAVAWANRAVSALVTAGAGPPAPNARTGGTEP